jgi:hypothetical protein
MGEPARVLEFKEKKPAAFGAMLKKTAKAKKPAKAKSTMPVLDPPEEVRDAVDEYIDAKGRETMAKAEKSAAETVVQGFTSGVQDADGFKGNFRNSYAVPGNVPGNLVKYISSNRFSINADDQETLQGMLGDMYEDMVQEDFSVKLRAEVFTDEGLQGELMELVGERFEDFFETVVALKVRERFNEKIYRAVEDDGLPDLRTYCRPYKPALR